MLRRLKRFATGLALVAWFWPASRALAQPKTAPAIIKVYAGSDGSAHLTDASGHELVVPKEQDQVDISQAAIAKDQQSVGWLAEFPNPDSTYAIPLILIVYRAGKIRRFGDGLLIVDWRFLADGGQIAFYSNTVHSDLAPHYELRDVRSGRLLGKWDGPRSEKAPRWTRELKD
ncbi:MAG TPA: hypothetical protein VEV17_02160 [Bryobacteraceae bacterium]|nr:hypothetical protein [Bryobacteraceae bacterium]